LICLTLIWYRNKWIRVNLMKGIVMKLNDPQNHEHNDLKKRGRMRTYWRRLMDSTQRKLSAGAAAITKLIPFPRGENWRRRDKR
jgi:hypothetical protein